MRQWTHYANALSGNLSLPAGPDFWVLSLSSNTDWKVEDGFNAGLSDETGKIKAISSTTTGDPLQDPLLNHTLTASKTSGAFQWPINYLENRTDPVPFVLGEVGSAIVVGHKDYALQDSLGAAVWTVDWLLVRRERWRRAGQHAVGHAEPILGMAARGREDRRDGQAGAGARGLVRPRVCGGRPRRYQGEVAGCGGGPGTRG
jgi:hypothetical protein